MLRQTIIRNRLYDMDVIFLQGGLGNQMFQYAFYLAKKRGQKVTYDCGLLSIGRQHNGFELEKLFGVCYKTNKIRLFLLRAMLLLRQKSNSLYRLWSLFIPSFFNLRLVEDTIPSLFDPNLLAFQNAYYYGYWQTEKYFLSIEEEVRQVFSFPLLLLSKKTVECKNLICTSNSISVHIRRGDYLKESNIDLYGGICTVEYYKESINYMNRKVANPIFVVFSDDIEWVKAHFQMPNAVYVDWNQGTDAWQDMFLMSQCKHNVMANSSFSWWGAWLNNNKEKIVISPSRFLNVGDSKDIISDGWIKL